MRRVIKDDNSEIVTQNLKYIEGNSAKNQNISKILFTKNTLDTVKILNPNVNSGLLQNAKLYF